jgi:hypothetical protein
VSSTQQQALAAAQEADPFQQSQLLSWVEL